MINDTIVGKSYLYNKDIYLRGIIRRILDLSFKYKLSHIGSNITAAPIIAEIFSRKKPDEKFILSSGHAHLSHLIIKYFYEEELSIGEVEKLIESYGIHCDRKSGCDASSGSLGHGLGIAVGMALADRTRNVYCLVSDGECAEGSIWEALRIVRENNVDNLKIYLNFNKWGAYKYISFPPTDIDPKNYGVIVKETNMNEWPEWLQGQQAHYVQMDEEKYKEALSILQ